MTEETVSTEFVSLAEDGDPTDHDHSLNRDWGDIDWGVAHRARDAATGQWVADCVWCATNIENIVENIRLRDRMVAEDLVVCSHRWSPCSHRDGDGLVARERATHCHRCNEWYCNDHSHMSPTGVASQRCAECDGVVPRCVETEWCDSHGASYCDTHEHSYYCDGVRSSEALEDDYREAQLLFADEGDHELAVGKRFAAVEIEAEYGGYFSLPNEFGITSDGSLDDGVEVTTPPARGKKLIEFLQIAMGEMKDSGWEVSSSRCSMHTHIDLRDKKDDMVFLSHLFATIYAIEDVLYGMQHGRDDSGYCDPLRRSWAFYDAYGRWAPDFNYVYLKADKTPQGKAQVDAGWHSHGANRYNGANFNSVGYRGTIEFRIHEGCLDWRDAAAWIELLQFVIAKVERGVTYKQLRKLLEMDADEAKIAEMEKFFGLPEWVTNSIISRMTAAGHLGTWRSVPYALSWTLGTPLKGRNPDPMKAMLKREATHWICQYCSRWISIANPGADLNYETYIGHDVYCTSRYFRRLETTTFGVWSERINGIESLGRLRDLSPRSAAHRQISTLIDSINEGAPANVR